MSAWGNQFSSGDQTIENRKFFSKKYFKLCPECAKKNPKLEKSNIEEIKHSAGCRMNGDAYGTTVFKCLDCKWETSFQWDDSSDCYYYETQHW
jgi:hypothetical protein